MDVDDEGTSFVGGASRAFDGTDHVGKIIPTYVDVDARQMPVSLYLHQLLLHPTHVQHCVRPNFGSSRWMGSTDSALLCSLILLFFLFTFSDCLFSVQV